MAENGPNVPELEWVGNQSAKNKSYRLLGQKSNYRSSLLVTGGVAHLWPRSRKDKAIV